MQKDIPTKPWRGSPLQGGGEAGVGGCGGGGCVRRALADGKLDSGGCGCHRVVFSCCSPDVFRQMMVRIRKAGLPLEEYVFLYIDVFGDSLNSNPRQPWARGDHDDHIAMEAYQSVKILTYREPQNKEYQDFVRHLKIDAAKNFNFTINDSLMNIIPGGFYDGLMLYTHALNETLSPSGERPPGRTVTEKMWNRTYHASRSLVQLVPTGTEADANSHAVMSRWRKSSVHQ
ncbi:hypothetical protein CRUP_028528 [Coryphaenoides rupestris]|nr:hypothetical protein CRUP_028528 [Coryphaenoides rupestris]